MFDIGFSEMVLLGIIALVVIGPKQLPEVARMAARFINDVKRVTAEFSGQFMAVKDQANKFIVDTQTEVTKEFTSATQDIASSTDFMKKYVAEPVIPPHHEGPLPEPDPPADLPDHTPYNPGEDGEPEQMTLKIGDEKKGEGSGGT